MNTNTVSKRKLNRAAFASLIGIVTLFLPALCRAQGYTITTIAGGGGFSAPTFGDGGPATSAYIGQVPGVAVDGAGNLYIADPGAGIIRKVTPAGTISTIAGMYPLMGYSGDGGPATSAGLGLPLGVAVDAAGNLYIADSGDGRIRLVTPAGVISTVAGGGSLITGNGDGGPATLATLSDPTGVAFDRNGNLYIADTARVRKVTSDGIITTVAGGGSPEGGIGDGGPATSVFLYAYSVAVDAAGNLYIADYGQNRIRKVATNGIITTVAGSGAGSYSGDGGPATHAGIDNPQGVAVDAAGNLYISDTGDDLIRLVTPEGVISTIAGNHSAGFSGDGGPANDAALDMPMGIALGQSGTVYVADYYNDVVRLLTPIASPPPGPPSIGANGIVTASAFGGFHAAAPGSLIEIYGSNLAGKTDNWGSSFQNGAAPTSLDGVSVTVGGHPAYIDFISALQVNVQVPANVSLGGPVPVVVSSGGQSSAAENVTVNALEPGLLATPSFNVGGKQYVTAFHGDFSLVGNGSIPGVATTPAKPGETIIFYGLGFGPVTNGVPLAGQLVKQSNSLMNPVTFEFGQLQGLVVYDGLALTYDGLYQFNVTVPSTAPNGDLPLAVTSGGVSLPQTLAITVHD